MFDPDTDECCPNWILQMDPNRSLLRSWPKSTEVKSNSQPTTFKKKFPTCKIQMLTLPSVPEPLWFIRVGSTLCTFGEYGEYVQICKMCFHSTEKWSCAQNYMTYWLNFFRFPWTHWNSQASLSIMSYSGFRYAPKIPWLFSFYSYLSYFSISFFK